jgi:hypothetical protein
MKTFQNYKNNKYENIPINYYNKYLDKFVDLLVCDFFWASSRKSYLPCGQTCDICSYDSIKECLLAGARVIQLDIYSDENGLNPIVRDKY